ncbi:MAG TPA: YifB family Mg chelatase-like AAA ATPase [Planctomycetota bacterium]|nr:YifB family Mg chelatase-like AAA ATPase [Planctomycetota bacterium]
MAAFARSVGAALFGVDARIVDIQVFLRGAGETGSLRIVGMGDGALKEGGERIRGAFLHAGYPWPQGAVTVNLAPASARKEGPGLDLPITLALLQACGSLGRADVLARTLVLGELTLDGRVRPVRGALAAAEAARKVGMKEALVPVRNTAEAAAVPGLVVRGVESLDDAVGHLAGVLRLPAVPPTPWTPARCDASAYREVRGQASAVRAALLAAAGAHNLMLTGAPGAGKTLLARALRGLLPPLTRDEALEVTRIHSAAGIVEGGLVSDRPFRSPHHTTSLAGLVGGGAVPRPGEVSLAHLGVLFLDELAEFPRAVLEGLRQPIEDGEITVGRAAGRTRFPSEIVIVAAMNPCPCGWLGSGVRPCNCPSGLSARYRSRVSGPLLDRFDLRVSVKPVDAGALLAPAAETPAADEASLLDARARQTERAARYGLPRSWNARIPSTHVRSATEPTPAALERLLMAGRVFGLTGRGLHRTLRVARTIADLKGSGPVDDDHVKEALQYRGDDEKPVPVAAPDAPGEAG